jgi:hypothetical protein
MAAELYLQARRDPGLGLTLARRSLRFSLTAKRGQADSGCFKTSI